MLRLISRIGLSVMVSFAFLNGAIAQYSGYFDVREGPTPLSAETRQEFARVLNVVRPRAAMNFKEAIGLCLCGG